MQREYFASFLSSKRNLEIKLKLGGNEVQILGLAGKSEIKQRQANDAFQGKHLARR